MRRRRISEPEAQRRERQRQTPQPAYASRASETPVPHSLSDAIAVKSAGTANVALDARPPPPLLHTRQQASRLLNCSIATLQRLEKAGVLTPVKLNKQSASGMTYYGHAQLLALASGGGHEPTP